MYSSFRSYVDTLGPSVNSSHDLAGLVKKRLAKKFDTKGVKAYFLRPFINLDKKISLTSLFFMNKVCQDLFDQKSHADAEKSRKEIAFKFQAFTLITILYFK